MHLVTDNTRARMARQRPITDALAWPRLWMTWWAQ